MDRMTGFGFVSVMEEEAAELFLGIGAKYPVESILYPPDRHSRSLHLRTAADQGGSVATRSLMENSTCWASQDGICASNRSNRWGS